jgi:CubicO group peptidase (beta-lactamase class C family)
LSRFGSKPDSLLERRFGNASIHSAYMFDLSTRDLARYGLLYLACGTWREAQLFPESWVRESITGIVTALGRENGDKTGFGLWGYLWQIDAGCALEPPLLAGSGSSLGIVSNLKSGTVSGGGSGLPCQSPAWRTEFYG